MKTQDDRILPSAIAKILTPAGLTGQEMTGVMQAVMDGKASDAQIGAFLMGLRARGETVDEIAAAARVMREKSTKVQTDTKGLVDTCGTGGSGLATFNISTTAALVAAAAGARVAKHGNRFASGKSGSADLLEAAGVRLDLRPEETALCIEKTGAGFLFAPNHHGAMKHVAAPRRELGVRTLFNLLGPLTNPAGAERQLLGVFAAEWVRPMAEVLQQLGSRHALVVHGMDGMDEISITGPTRAAELKDRQITEYTLNPEDFGTKKGQLAELLIQSPQESLQKVRQLLTNPAEDAASGIVSLNAGAAIYVAGICGSLQQGVQLAREALANGSAAAKLAELAEFTQALRSS